MNPDLIIPHLLVLLIVKVTFGNEVHPLSDEFINAINERQSLWKAGRNFKEDTPMNYINKLRGCRLERDKPLFPEFRHDLENLKIPDSFDWRDHYRNCSTLRDIRDQGSCGSCWANAVVEVISDRICIHSHGKKDVYISTNDLLSCCTDCGDCGGGYEDSALDYWRKTGIVTGGPYNSTQGCRPYEIPPCEHHVHGPRPSCEGIHSPTPQCKRTCQSDYSRSYEADLHFGQPGYCLPNDVKHIQADIMKNGPVTAGFTVYDDFLHYKTGVYKHTVGDRGKGHAVKLLGWGVENDIPYWLVANSWNTDWGDKGYVKFLRGENHCGIESRVEAALPV